MKYFTKELWDKVNICNSENQLEVENEWFENCRNYAEQFNKIKSLLSQEFIEKYLENNDFHDFGIVGIEILKSESKAGPFLDLKLRIVNGQKKNILHYVSIDKLNISSYENNDIENLLNREGVIDSWGYDEFEIIDNRLLVHEILFLSGNILRVEFKNIFIVDEVLS